MRVLPNITPTPEQLPIISANRLGIEVIRGAAGSGKTSTAILRLRSLAYMFEARRERQGNTEPVKLLVLAFNRTLAGYIRALTESQVTEFDNTDLEINTFAKWALSLLGSRSIVSDSKREELIYGLARQIPLTASYVVKEVDYLLGRFEPDNLESYMTVERTGRGAEPRVDRALRRRLLDEVVYPYKRWLAENNQFDWNDVAVDMARSSSTLGYDIVIVDESQDFSANQLRAIKHHMAEEYAVTFVIDTAQRIYARGFTWAETGFDMQGARYHTLRANHRNTVQIAAFAAGILTGLPVEEDGALPRLESATRTGPLPVVLKGRYDQQASWALKYIRDKINLDEESVAFLKPQGGGYFDRLKELLDESDLAYVNITREADWPETGESIALSTFHSAKGLEFDYVVILGLNDRNTNHGDDNVDDQLTVLRRLLAVAVARARKEVIIGYKPGEESDLVDYFSRGTFREVDLNAGE